ncbi:hypothetical protein [Paraburkholderia hayleyella]|uniref:hypothetical protein n=1 Tax=Paraburkholderia hayleyella TaxID=2152889 RepID=UPI0012909E72|nr:hypothetical protein [Paraburkholderia hayleyella]
MKTNNSNSISSDITHFTFHNQSDQTCPTTGNLSPRAQNSFIPPGIAHPPHINIAGVSSTEADQIIGYNPCPDKDTNPDKQPTLRYSPYSAEKNQKSKEKQITQHRLLKNDIKIIEKIADAIEQKNIKKINYYISKEEYKPLFGTNYHAKNKRLPLGSSLVFLAVKHSVHYDNSDPEGMKILEKILASVDNLLLRAQNDLTLFHYSVINGNLETVKLVAHYIKDRHPNNFIDEINTPNKSKTTPFAFATRRSLLEIKQAILDWNNEMSQQQGIETAPNLDQATPSAPSRHSEFTIKQEDKEKFTHIIAAIIKKDLSAINNYLSQPGYPGVLGINYVKNNQSCPEAFNPCFLATQLSISDSTSLEILEKILEKILETEGKLLIMNKNNLSLFHYAVTLNHLPTVELIAKYIKLCHPVDFINEINKQNMSNSSPFMTAIKNKNLALILKLLEWGVDLSQRQGKRQISNLDIALNMKNKYLNKYLKNIRSNKNNQNPPADNTALNRARSYPPTMPDEASAMHEMDEAFFSQSPTSLNLSRNFPLNSTSTTSTTSTTQDRTKAISPAHSGETPAIVPRPHAMSLDFLLNND